MTVKEARLLGACLHADTTKRGVWGCFRNARKIEAFVRVVDHIGGSRYTPTRRKGELYKIYALPTLAYHALSACFNPNEAKIVQACQRLVPKHPHGRGLGGFASSPLGFGVLPVKDYTDAQRTRAYIAANQFTGKEDLPSNGFGRRRPDTTRIPHVCRQILHHLTTLRPDTEVIVGTDGGYTDGNHVGTIGFSVNGEGYGARLRGITLSSTHAEVAAAIVMATLLREGGISPQRVRWWCDSKNAIQRQEKAKLGDPAGEILGFGGLPAITWDKGHATNRAINVADAACTAARSDTTPFDLEWVYTANATPYLCYSYDVDTVQLEDPHAYIRSVRCHIRDDPLRREIRKLVPAVCTTRRIVRRLMYIPGACDILQAISRRVILQFGSKRECRVEGCTRHATAEHTLLVNDPRHSGAYGRWGDRAIPYPTESPTLERILTDFARGIFPTMLYCCERIGYQEDDDHALGEWCEWLKRRILLREEYRERGEDDCADEEEETTPPPP
eukprot:TRINITY_DN10716_c0_g3_i1.p1 TRINITY_DN10716_c0_g3~~TRINITY_DN10716_c0_g3_i1.p1  ORF type:complete len:580 (+),score=-51.78 TRINITY_DN10716_c0_g3_i1:236-1741(+)